MIHAVGELIPHIHSSVFVHPSAVILGDVRIGPDSSVWPCAVIRGDFAPVRIGARTSIQDGVVVHAAGSGTTIGDDCVVGHQAFVEEAVVDDACLVGVGAKVLNGVHMGTGSVAAAGAVLVPGTRVPPGHRAQGVPARTAELRGPSREEIVQSAASYVDMARRVAAAIPENCSLDRAGPSRHND